MKHLCVACRHWTADDDDQTFGECHRHAPRPMPLIQMNRVMGAISGEPYEPDEHDEYLNRAAFWPTTQCDDWCGEWKTRDDS